MKLLFIFQYFYPDISSTPQLLTDLAEDLQKMGYEVVVVSGQASYIHQSKYPLNEEYQGVKIKRTFSLALGKKNYFFRIIDFIFFYFFAFFRSLFEKKADIIISLSNPPFLSNLGLLLSKIKKCRYIYLIEDIYPDIAEELKIIKKGGFLSKISNRLAKISMTQADSIITLGKYMKEKVVQKGIPSGKIFCIDNWADGDKIFPLKDDSNPFKQKEAFKNKFIVQYSGNMGIGHNFKTILSGAKKLKEYHDILFLFIGDGTRKKEIEDFIAQNNLSNIILLPYQEREKLLFSLNACDVSLISLRKGLEGIMVPCKLYGIMAAGKSIIFLGSRNCEIGGIISESNCGYIIPEGKVNEFVNAVLELYHNPDLRLKMGQSGRIHFEEYYDRKIAVEKYNRILSKA